MGKNTDVIGVILLLFLVSGVLGDKGRGSGRSLLGGLEPIGLVSDFHRMVGVTDKLDSMGQIVINPPKLPEPTQLTNTNAIPNLDGIIEMMGPLLSNLNK